MLDDSSLVIIRSNPIGSDLGEFRTSVDNGASDSSRIDHAVALVEILQRLPAARLLPSVKGDRGKLRNDLLRLEDSLTTSNDINPGPVGKLLEVVLLNKSDDCIWSQAYDTVKSTLTTSPADQGLKDTLGPWYGIFQKKAQQHDFSEYLITKRGSQGEVRFEIDDQDRGIAVKTIYYGDRKDVGKAIQDFERESQSLESLRHPSIVRILGHADDPEKRQAVLTMEWASCKLSETGSADLRDIIALRDHRCRENKAPSYLPEGFLWHVLFHLGSALALCHHGIAIQTTQIREQADSKDSLQQLDPDPPAELLTIAEHTPSVFWTTQQISFFKKPNHEPIVHRDIKPSNVLLSDPPVSRNETSGNWQLSQSLSLDNTQVFTSYPKILLGDFGLCAPVKDAHTRAIGTFEYCAPEVPQELGRPDSPPFDWTTNCDMFSLGATLWHLTSLHGPPESVQDTEIQPPLPSNYSQDLRDLITMCCSFNDMARPTAIDVLTACIKRAYWDETYVGPYGLPIAFDFTKTLAVSLQKCRIGTITSFEPTVSRLLRPKSFLQDLGILFQGAGEPLSIFVAGAYMRRQLEHRRGSYFLVPMPRRSIFIGQQDIIEMLHGRVDEMDNTQVRMSLYGLGGIGKTQIALEFAHEFQSRNPQASIFWINATSVATIQESYYRIGVACDIPGVDRLESACMLRVNRWLESTRSGRWLIIADNADDPDVISQVTGAGSLVFPPNCPRGYILWTTRNSGLAYKVSSPSDAIQVSGLSESEGTTLLSELTASGKHQGVLRDQRLLARALEHLPLAITQAASYMKMYGVSAGEYLKYLNSFKETYSVLTFEHTDSTRKRGWESLYNTWSLSFDQLSPYTINVLSLMSFLQPDSIPTSLLSQEFAEKLQLHQALSELRKFSFIDSNDEGKTFSIHRLVQNAVQIRLEAQDSRQTKVDFMSMALRLLARVFKPNEDDERKDPLELLPHAIQVLSFELSATEDLLARAHLLEQVSRFELRLGRLEGTKELASEAFQIHVTLHGSTDLQTLKCQVNLARVLCAMGIYGEARTHAEQAASGLANIDMHGSDHLNSMDVLAHVFQRMGLYHDADRVFRLSINQRTQKLGEAHPSTLTNRTSLASVLNSQGRLMEAEGVYEQCIDMMNIKLGTEHPNTLAAKNDYASVLDNLGRFDEAEAIHQENLAARGRALGEAHPDTVASMENLATVLGHKGRYTEAAELHRHTVEELSNILGEEHPDVITSVINLAVALAEEGSHREAGQLCTEAVQLRERVLGEDHPATHASRSILEGIHNLEEIDGSNNILSVNNTGAVNQIHGGTFMGALTFGGY